VLLRFSIKEAVYKAIDPFVQRFVGFREVAVFPEPDGQVAVRAHLQPPAPLTIRARWTTHDQFYITSARARM